MAMGEAADEAEARLMMESQQRGSVNFNPRTGRYRWTVVLDGGKSAHGYADSDAEGWQYVRDYVAAPHRSVRRVMKTRRGGIPPA